MIRDVADVVMLGAHEILALDVLVDSDEVDLWAIGEEMAAEFDRALAAAIRESLGENLDAAVFVCRGSLRVRIVALWKTAWTASGKRVAGADGRERVDVSALEGAVHRTVARVLGGMRSKRFQTRVRTTGKVLSWVAHVGTFGFRMLEMAGMLPQGSADTARATMRTIIPPPGFLRFEPS